LIFSKKRKNFLKFSLLTILMAMLMACSADQSPINFKTNATLKNQYNNVASDRYVKIYYNVKQSAGGTFIDFAVKNVSGMYASNFTINLSQCCRQNLSSKMVHKYINLGSIKMSSIKKSNFRIPDKDIDTVQLNYSFDPRSENFFPEASKDKYNVSYQNKISGSLNLIIK